MDSTTKLLEVKHELDAYFARYGLKMSREGIRDSASGALLRPCETAAEMTRLGLEEVERRAAQ